MKKTRGVKYLAESGDPADLVVPVMAVPIGVVREDRITYGRAENTEDLAEQIKRRTFRLAVETIDLLDEVYDSPSVRVIRYQLLKAVTSVGANYRAVCQARSDKEFFAKMSIVVEEADETSYWLELLEATKINIDKQAVTRLHGEAQRLSSFFSKSRATMKKRLKKQRTDTRSSCGSQLTK